MYDTKISVIVPVYNVGAYLPECVRSIREQTHRNLEILLVDDGATDGSGELCDVWAAEDDRIRVIHQENGGLSAARNSALDVATGDFIGFVDGDDWVSPDFFEHLLRALRESGAEISICGYRRVYPGGHRDVRPSGKQLLSAQEAIARFMTRCDGIRENMFTSLYARHLFEGIRFPVGRVYEDVATKYRLMERAERISVIPDCIYFYRQRSGSITQIPFSDKRYDLLRAIREMQEDPYLQKDPLLREAVSYRKMMTACDLLKDAAMTLTHPERAPYEKMLQNAYLHVHKNRRRILRNPRLSKLYKGIAVLSMLPYPWMIRVLESRPVKAVTGSRNVPYSEKL